MSTHLMKAFLSFLSIHHSVISSQTKKRVVTFGLTFMILIINWPIPVSVYCLMASDSISVILRHPILPIRISLTLNLALINASHLFCYMPAVFGAIIWNILVLKLGCSKNFKPSLRRNFCFGWRYLV